MTDTRLGQSLARGVAIACVLGLVVAGVLWWALKDANKKHVTAYFPSAIGLYVGNSVRVLGVDMGTITGVQPMGNQVRVDMEYDRTIALPADAQAAIVAPSLVSDRYVQLAPAYTGGKIIADGATIPLNRTAVPIEVDDLYSSLDKISQSLGPNGVNKNGSLSDLLTTLSNNFDGNGQSLHDTITKLSQLSTTLSGNKNDLFATVGNLANFSQTLADSDKQVRQFESQLADVSGYLAGEKDNLAATVRQLGTTLAMVQQFIDSHHDQLRSNVDNLASVTKVLVDQRSALAQILDIAPVGLGNVANAYNGSAGTLDARPNLNELTQPPIVMVCGLLKEQKQLAAVGNLCDKVEPILDGTAKLPSLAQTAYALQHGQLPPLPLPFVDLTGSGASK
ncbi:MCE family protein [Amycolatopsis pithecellobii]|uniref:MCE family protein n=1 Tax=Amycolatopsis pithecellobii TaxID=664692 RepID=A0A6N7YXD9_9PSEU|nr:MCE family protein [Amycolatopsis pithecellobii]MTD57757.1 MCE family protein [Amycolatopsis pithecellobii]